MFFSLYGLSHDISVLIILYTYIFSYLLKGLEGYIVVELSSVPSLCMRAAKALVKLRIFAVSKCPHKFSIFKINKQDCHMVTYL